MEEEEEEPRKRQRTRAPSEEDDRDDDDKEDDEDEVSAPALTYRRAASLWRHPTTCTAAVLTPRDAGTERSQSTRRGRGRGGYESSGSRRR